MDFVVAHQTAKEADALVVEHRVAQAAQFHGHAEYEETAQQGQQQIVRQARHIEANQDQPSGCVPDFAEKVEIGTDWKRLFPVLQNIGSRAFHFRILVRHLYT